MSQLRQHVADYLTLRRALGYKLEAHEPLLNEFVDDLEQAGTSTVTIEAALACATKPQGVQPFRWKQRLTVIRGFARYLHSMDPATQVPPSDLLAYRRRRLALHAGAATGRKFLDVGQSDHRGVAGRGHGECTVRRAVLDGRLQVGVGE